MQRERCSAGPWKRNANSDKTRWQYPLRWTHWVKDAQSPPIFVFGSSRPVIVDWSLFAGRKRWRYLIPAMAYIASNQAVVPKVLAPAHFLWLINSHLYLLSSGAGEVHGILTKHKFPFMGGILDLWPSTAVRATVSVSEKRILHDAIWDWQRVVRQWLQGMHLQKAN